VKAISNAAIDFLSVKPHVGFALVGGGFLSGVMTLLQILTPILGFLGAAIGFAAGIYTFLSARRNWKQGKDK